MSNQAEPRTEENRDKSAQPDPSPELTKLVELSAKYPEIGPPLADLCFKIGQPQHANRIVRMGLEGDAPGLEYYFVAASAARREQRHEEVFRLAVDAVRAFVDAADDAITPNDGQRLLHLVRQAFATLMFDVKDVSGQPGFTRDIAAELARLEPRMGTDPFYRSLLAQALWFEDRERSEQEWERAAELGEPEPTWNARGTWYREAEADLDKAERAYRTGLEKAPASALLLHNLAQVLVERARGVEDDPELIRRLLKEADKLLRAALREEGPKGLRRHIHATRDRLNDLRASLPPRERRGNVDDGSRKGLPSAGDTVLGKVRSVAPYGAFVALPGGSVGLLHKSELSHEPVADATAAVEVGDELEVKVLDISHEDGKTRPRIGLSRKALLPAPPESAGQAQGGEPGRARPAGGKPRGKAQQAGAGKGGARGDGRKRRGPRPERRDDGRHERRDDRRDAGRPRRESEAERKKQEKLASLGEMLLAKLEEGSKN